MSASEILAQLPNLPLEEVAAIYHRAEELLHDQSVTVTPELLAAIDEADASPEAEDIAADDLRNRVTAWARSK